MKTGSFILVLLALALGACAYPGIVQAQVRTTPANAWYQQQQQARQWFLQQQQDMLKNQQLWQQQQQQEIRKRQQLWQQQQKQQQEKVLTFQQEILARQAEIRKKILLQQELMKKQARIPKQTVPVQPQSSPVVKTAPMQPAISPALQATMVKQNQAMEQMRLQTQKNWQNWMEKQRIEMEKRKQQWDKMNQAFLAKLQDPNSFAKYGPMTISEWTAKPAIDPWGNALGSNGTMTIKSNYLPAKQLPINLDYYKIQAMGVDGYLNNLDKQLQLGGYRDEVRRFLENSQRQWQQDQQRQRDEELQRQQRSWDDQRRRDEEFQRQQRFMEEQRRQDFLQRQYKGF